MNAVKANEKKIETIENNIVSAKDSEEKAKTIYEDLYNSFIEGQSDTLREKLNRDIQTKGSCACPVCGTVHSTPVMQNTHSNVIDEKTVRNAKSEYDNAHNNVMKFTTELTEETTKVRTTKERIVETAKGIFGEMTWETISAEVFLTEKKDVFINEAQASLCSYEKARKDDEQRLLLETQKAESEKHLKDHSDKITDLEKMIIELQSRLKECNCQINELAEKLSEYKTIHDAESRIKELTAKREEYKTVIENAGQRLRDAEKNHEGLKSTLNTLNEQKRTSQSELDKTREEYSALIIKNGFADENDYHHYLNVFSSSDREEALKKRTEEINNFYTELSSLKERAEEYASKTKDYKYTDLAELNEEIQRITAAYENSDKLLTKMRCTLDNHEKTLDNAKNTKKEYTYISAKAESVNRLHQLASATSGTEGGKIDFERWNMIKTFREIVDHASGRLDTMSGGRLHLEHSATAEKANKSAGLEINVEDMTTGTTREVRSVSGGEAFQISMAFALGLSDVVQSHSGGVKIESMFIDEGFGTLDDEVLAKSLETLRDIKVNQIGIISHVSELEKNIEKKIVVHKTAKGSKIDFSCI